MIENFETSKIKNIEDLQGNLKNIEFLVRHTNEYRDVLRYMKEDLQLRYSMTFPNIDFVDEKISFEMHHIISLGSICLMTGTLMLSELKEDQYLLTLDIARKVVEYHLDDIFPMVMLSTTEHQLVHKNLFTVDKNNISLHKGNTKQLFKVFGDLLTENEIETLKTCDIQKEPDREVSKNSEVSNEETTQTESFSI